MDTEIVPQTAVVAETTEPAPVTETPTTEGIATAVNTVESAPTGDIPKSVEELKEQRKKRQQAEQEAAYWRGVAEGRNQQPAAQPTAPQPQPVAQPPKLDDFESYAEWEVAKDKYILDQAATEAEKRLQQKIQAQQQQQKIQEQVGSYQKRIFEAAEEDPTILDIAQDPTLPARNPGVVSVVMQSDVAPDLVRWLHNNRKDASRINNLDPILAAKEMGVIEERIKNKPKPEPPKKVSQAPEPIPTITPSGSVTVDEDNLPMDQWMARRNKAVGYR